MIIFVPNSKIAKNPLFILLFSFNFSGTVPKVWIAYPGEATQEKQQTRPFGESPTKRPRLSGGSP